jgi:preprotein translocase subunit SecB
MADPASPGAAGFSDPAAPGDSRQVLIQKVYIKDASIESPQAPKIFTTAVQPQIDINVATQTTPLQDDLYNVILTVTITAKIGEETAFLVEVHQGGIFLVRGFSNPAEKGIILGGYCASMLFPFAREAVADFVQKAGFPPLLLQPINFEGMYLEQMARARAENKKVILDPSAPAAAH